VLGAFATAPGSGGTKPVVRGHLAYFAVPGNSDALVAFVDQVKRLWLKALRRRSQKANLTWERMTRLAGIYGCLDPA